MPFSSSDATVAVPIEKRCVLKAAQQASQRRRRGRRSSQPGRAQPTHRLRCVASAVTSADHRDLAAPWCLRPRSRSSASPCCPPRPSRSMSPSSSAIRKRSPDSASQHDQRQVAIDQDQEADRPAPNRASAPFAFSGLGPCSMTSAGRRPAGPAVSTTLTMKPAFAGLARVVGGRAGRRASCAKREERAGSRRARRSMLPSIVDGRGHELDCRSTRGRSASAVESSAGTVTT